jgi:hypothetical protein
MQKKSTKQSPSANAQERAFMAWCKEQPSIISGEYGVEVHHCVGSSRRVYVGMNRVRIGHWFLLPLTPSEHWLYHNRKSEFIDQYGEQSQLWERLIQAYPVEIPLNVIQGILQNDQ